MLSRILGAIVSTIVLFGAGALSYIYFERTMGPRDVGTSVAFTNRISSTSNPVASTTPKTAPKTAVKKPIKMPSMTVVKTNGSLATQGTTTIKNVIAPGPLRMETTVPILTASSAELSTRGVIEYTNSARSLNGGLPALIENETLDRDARIKLDDMFAKQYFEHVSPTGVGPGDIAKAVGYAYVVVGENLALGDFQSDEDLVTAWMNSPGHRANILNGHYQEIGVAVGKGMYDGREVWLAVQSFGMPLSACPSIDVTMKIQIDDNSIHLISMRALIDAKKAQMDSTLAGDQNYNTYVGEFNTLILPYNILVEKNRATIAVYNAQVQAFNSCINNAGTH